MKRKPIKTQRRQCSIRKLDLLEAVQKLKNSVQPVMVQFKAKWCGACSANEPELAEAACKISEMRGLDLFQIDVDENPLIAQEFGIENLPTVAVIQGGRVLEKHEGVNTAAHWQKVARDWLRKNGYQGDL